MAKAHLKVKNAKTVNVFSHEVQERDLYIKDGLILGYGPYSFREEMDLQGAYVSPGFIESHLHIESSLLTPPALSALVAPHGTSLIIADPHEIANVMGLEGIYYLIKISSNLATDFLFMAPSCVPSSPLETTGASLDAEDLRPLLSEQQVLGLGEMMNFPGVMVRDPALMAKIRLFSERPIDGHAPGLTGTPLEAYLRAGIQGDHECTSLDEAKEKLDRGMLIMIREGTTARNLDTLLELVTPERCSQFVLVSDDLHPEDIDVRGHLDHLLRRSVSLGLNPLIAIKMVTINPARHFGLRMRGALAPGYRADLVAFSDLRDFKVIATFKDGKVTSREGELLVPKGDIYVPESVRFQVKWPQSLEIKALKGRIRVIKLVSEEILTQEALEKPTVRRGLVVADPERDLLKLMVLERHKATGHFGIGFVRGFGLRVGALASSIAHDSHNIIAVGTNDEDMLLAARTLASIGGGQVVAAQGHVEASLPLPVAGLMSDAWADEVIAQSAEVHRAARRLGALPHDSFMALSFLALPVVPELKLTDLGLVDVREFKVVSLFEE